MKTDSAFVGKSTHPVTSFFVFLLKLGALGGMAAVLLGFLGGVNWFADLFAQLRVQWAIGFLGLIVLFLLMRRKRWALICLAMFALNGIPIAPYVAGTFNPAIQQKAVKNQTGDSLRLMSLNALTHNKNHIGVINSIHDTSPDFLILMEIDSRWQQVIEAKLSADYPHAVFEARDDNFGIAFLSKRSWSEQEIFSSGAFQVPSIDVTFPRPDQKPLRIIATHPVPPMSPSRWKARREQLGNAARRFDSSTGNLMVGDFNLTPWSPNYKKVLAAGSLRDASKPFGLAPTWYVFPSWIGALKIDHAFVSEDISVTGLKIGPDVGSDHRAVILDFHF